MTRALTLCSLLLIPLSACDDAALDLVDTADQPSAVPDPPVAPAPADCEVYCADHREACGATAFGYTSVSECEALCGYWEDEESVECRLDILDDIALGAAETLESACTDAGPDSAPCGSAYVVTCDRYCDKFRTTCSDEGSFEASFESPQQCREWCEGEPLLGADDSIECRLGALQPSPTTLYDCQSAAPDVSCK